MNETRALQLIAAALAAGRVEFTYHALNESMPDRGLSVSDFLGALETATAGEPQNDEGTKWKVYGRLLKTKSSRSSSGFVKAASSSSSPRTLLLESEVIHASPRHEANHS